MRKKIKRTLAGFLSSILVISSVMPVFARERSAIPYRSSTKSISASISGPTFASDTVELDPKCHLFGSAACEEGEDLVGNPCYWTAKQYGDLAMTATLTAASFGADTSYTDIMAQSRMVSDNILHSYEKQAALFTTYRRANTRLYY